MEKLLKNENSKVREKFTVKWIGNTVMSIEPQGTVLAHFNHSTQPIQGD